MDREGRVPSPDPDADWWLTDDVAAYLKVTTGTLRGYLSRGQMPAPDRRFGRSNAWRPATIIGWHQGRPKVGEPTFVRGNDIIDRLAADPFLAAADGEASDPSR